MSLIFCLPTAAEAGVDGRVVDVGGEAVEDAAGAVLRTEGGVLGVVAVFGFFFSVEVVEVAVEFIEAVDGGEVGVAVAEVVFTKLTGRVALCLQQARDRGVFFL